MQEEFDKVIGLVDGHVPPAEMQFFEELHQYMLENEGSWAIGDGFLCFIGNKNIQYIYIGTAPIILIAHGGINISSR